MHMIMKFVSIRYYKTYIINNDIIKHKINNDIIKIRQLKTLKSLNTSLHTFLHNIRCLYDIMKKAKR